MHFLRNAWTIGVASLVSIVLQSFAIVLLPPESYGLFAVFYMVLGLGNAVIYAMVCEPWSTDEPSIEDWRAYATTLLAVSLVSFIPSLTIGLVTRNLVPSVFFGVAVGASIYRLGARYFSVVVGHSRYVARADSWASICLIFAFASCSRFLPLLNALAASWAVSAFVSVFLSEPLRIDPRYWLLRRWVSERWGRIKFLVADSILFELGSSGVSLVMAPLLGLSDFGIYRSVSSAAIPVRLALNPVRPSIARWEVDQILSWRTAVKVFGVGGVMGGVVAGFLGIVRYIPFLKGSTVEALAAFRLPVGLFVVANMVGTFYYLSLRVKLGGRRLLGYRAQQLVLALLFPGGGFLIAGLRGAIWGYVLIGVAMMLSAWLSMMNFGRRELSSVAESSGF